MNKWLIGLVGIISLSNVCIADDKLVLQDEKDRINYSVGYQIGGDFNAQGLSLVPELLVRGIEDAISEGQPMMTPEEMRTTLVNFKKMIVAAQNEQHKAVAEKNRVEGQEFLAQNSKKEGVVELPSGLQYRILKEGKGESPQPSDTVTVHYRGRLVDGTEFDSSYSRNEPATFPANRVIQGWQEALQLMKPGAKYELFIPPELAYGKSGGGGKIGPNSTLIFEVELLEVESSEGSY